MKKVLALILALVMALSLVACSKGGNDKPDDNKTQKVKVGFITLHDENSTYDLNFINAAKEACQTLGLVENEDYFIKKNVPEGQEATTLPPSWLSRAATSSLPIALATSPT